jgi:hypothetical protein
MTVRIWLWVDLHRSRNWPWLHNVSTSDSLAKGEDYKAMFLCFPSRLESTITFAGFIRILSIEIFF